jgi:xylulokinase
LPGANGLLFLPYLAGERTPHFDPDARGAFLGLDARHGRAELARAVLEGISFALADAWSVVQQTTATLPDVVVLAGGGSRSAFWRQLLADVFGLPVRGVKGGDQSALGAAMLGGAAIGFHPADLVESWIRYEPEQAPDPAAHDRLDALFQVFRNAYRANRAMAGELSGWGKAGRPDFPPAV